MGLHQGLIAMAWIWRASRVDVGVLIAISQENLKGGNDASAPAPAPVPAPAPGSAGGTLRVCGDRVAVRPPPPSGDFFTPRGAAKGGGGEK
jgi:hypothetical protein